MRPYMAGHGVVLPSAPQEVHVWLRYAIALAVELVPRHGTDRAGVIDTSGQTEGGTTKKWLLEQ